VSPSLVRHTRQERERREEQLLAEAATLSSRSKGRERAEEADAYRTDFERDRDRILHSKAFRRLKHKTQVFINPDGDHFVTRLTHTLQVAQIGRAIAKALSLNEALAEAICLGHDIGHSPFGHTGEEALTPYAQQLGSPAGEWLHSVQSVRVVRKLEPLNLTHEVRDGLRAHSWRIEPAPETPEGDCCRFADRIAYLAHDALDAMRAGVITIDQIPSECVAAFGEPGREWIHTMIVSVIDESVRTGAVGMEPTVLEAMNTLRDFMFEHVYLRPEAREQGARAITVIRDLVDWFAEHPGDIPAGYALDQDADLQQAVDYVAGMSDAYALRTHDRLFRPAGMG
jgi:dGTPase